MKKRPINKLLIFLEHLESNVFSPDKRTGEVLANSFPPKKDCAQIIDLCLKKKYIEIANYSSKGYRVYNITIDGLEFLEGLRRSEREKRYYQLQGQLVYTSVILSLSSVFGLINQFYFSYKIAVQLILLFIILGLSIKMLFTLLHRG